MRIEQSNSPIVRVLNLAKIDSGPEKQDMVAEVQGTSTSRITNSTNIINTLDCIFV